MRTVLAAALMLAATTGGAEELSAQSAAAKTEEVAKPAPTKREDEVAAKAVTAAPIATTGERSFKPPAGYRLRRVDGGEVYCAKLSMDGSRFKQEVCRTEAQLRDMARENQTMKNELDRRQRACEGIGCMRR